MKKHLKIFWSLLVVLPLLTGISGCKKFLDRKPLGAATEGDLSQGGVEGKVFGLYGLFRSWGMTDFPILWFKSIRSDDAAKGSSVGDQAEGGQIFDNFGYGGGKDFWLANGYWDDHFNFVYACNDVIHDIDSLNLTDPGSFINKAEARFFRGYAYFDLVRDYGQVPLIDFKIYKIADGNKPKKTVAEIYAFIEQDLTFAAQYLPLNWSSSFAGRLTKGAANTLLAKVLLYQKKWATAFAKAEEVINSGQYSLLPSYVEFFKESGENSSESILEVQMYVSTNGSQQVNNLHNGVQGVRGSGQWDLGWGFNVPTSTLETSYETGDPRKAATILYSGQPDGIYGQTVPSAPPLAQPYWNKKIYSDPARRATTGILYAMWLNIRLERYADVLLMATEAANELGGAANTTKALGYLEMIRARARGGAAVLPPVITTDQTMLRTAIKKERRAEFAMEYERFYDLVRWGDAVTVLGSLGYTPCHQYFPIPQPAIDRSAGVLVQNPCW